MLKNIWRLFVVAVLEFVGLMIFGIGAGFGNSGFVFPIVFISALTCLASILVALAIIARADEA